MEATGLHRVFENVELVVGGDPFTAWRSGGRHMHAVRIHAGLLRSGWRVDRKRGVWGSERLLCPAD